MQISVEIINVLLSKQNLKVVFSNVKVEGRQNDDDVDNDAPWYPEDPGPDEEDIVRE
jgi:hypothetical protein